MKKLHLLATAIILLCLSGISVQAQSTKQEFSIGAGVGANSAILSTLDDLTSITATAGGVKYDNEKYLGPWSMEFFTFLSPKIGVGGIWTYARTKKDILIGGSKSGSAKVNYFSILPAVKLGWFERTHCAMYSKLAAGVTLRHEKQNWNDGGADNDMSKNKVMFNFQLSLAGIEVGGSKIRVFGELGFGEQGILFGGVRYRF